MTPFVEVPKPVAALGLASIVALPLFVVALVLCDRPPAPAASGLCAIPHVGPLDCRGAP
jgi:hypothetical protein